MSISSDARKKLRIAMQNIETADEIINLLDSAASNATNYTQNFISGDWVSSDGGDLYSITITHNLNSTDPIVRVYESNSEVFLHSIRVIDNNNIKLSVSRQYVDSRFSGKVIIDK